MAETKKIKLSKIKLNPNNPRLIKDDKFKKLVESIKEFPEMLELRPVVCNSDMIILGGNMRFKAAKKAGLKEIPVIIADSLDEAKQRQFVIKDNVSGGEWDWAMLADEWEEQELSDWGLDLPEDWGGVEVLPDEEPSEATMTPPDEPVSKPGDLWLLGDHRVLCGDSTNITDVERLMNGKKADMVFTDPPYRIETEGGCNGAIGSALMSQGRSIEFISDFDPFDFLSVLPNVFNKNHNSYIFCNKDLLPDYLIWAKENKISFNVLVWKKPNAIPIGDSHRPDIEYLLLFRKNAIWNNGLKGVSYSRLIEQSRETGLHPTMKPVELIENQVFISSHKRSIVSDLFLGSGSTLIACEKTNRICYGMELEPRYVDVIIKRWQEYTGKDATLESTGQTFEEVSKIGSLSAA